MRVTPMSNYFDFNMSELTEFEPLILFPRNEDTERYLDNKILEQERRSCLSIHMFCRKLEKLEEDFNANRNFRSRLITFLASGEDIFIHDLQSDWSSDEYLQRLKNHLDQLKRQFGVIDRLRYQNMYLHKLIETINSSLLDVDYDLSRLRFVRRHWYISTYTYGLRLTNNTNNTNNILLINNLDIFSNIKVEAGLILFITVPITVDELKALFSRHLPFIIIYRSDSGIIKTVEPLQLLCIFSSRITHLANNIIVNKKIFPEEKELFSWVIEEINEIENLLVEFARHTYMHREHKDHSTQYIYNKIKNLKLRISHLEYVNIDGIRKLAYELGELADTFNRLEKKYRSIGLLPETISDGIRNITTNSNLYRITNKLLFNENNLTASLVTWLKASLIPKGFHIVQEDPLANGRTDISVYSEGQRLTIVESKLLHDRATDTDIQRKINEAIFQLYIKYSDSVAQSLITPPELFLILFCFDSNNRKLRNTISVALDKFNSEYNRLKLIVLESASHHSIRFCLQESGGPFADKAVNIKLIIANLRTKDNEDEKHGNYR